VTRANTCDTPRLCSRDGWCFENPLPQGNTIRGAWAAGPREVYLVGDNATALLWNGERHSVIALPAVADGVDFLGVHGTSPQDIFIVGSRGTILHFDGLTWSQESIQGGSNAAYRAVLARSGAPAIAVGSGNSIVRRQPDAGWRDDLLTDGLISFTGLGPDSEGRLFALGTYPSLSRAVLMRERDAGPGQLTWDRGSRPPLINGNAMWVSPDGGFFIAGLADAGAGQPRVGMILKQAEDAGWDEVLRVPDELRALTGVTSEELFAAGDNGLFLHATDAGVITARAGTQWNALALADQGPLLEGRAGQVARGLSDGGLSLVSGGTTLNVNQICGSSTADLFAASQGTPGCTGALCAPLSLERSTTGTTWNQVPRLLPDSSELTACASFVNFRWFTGDDTRYTDLVPGPGWQVQNPLSEGLPRTSSRAIWVESGVSVWITNRTQPPPNTLPHVTHARGAPLNPVHRAVTYDGGGDLITVMGGGWALGERGLAFTVLPDGGLAPAARLGTEDFTSIADEGLIDGGTLAIATGLNGALYSQEGVAGFVAEQPLEADLMASWVGTSGDSYVVGADISDGGRRVSRVYRRVGTSWVRVPFAGDRLLSTVWAGTLPDGGHSVWVGGSTGWILSRP
jgi:hypothetical protein